MIFIILIVYMFLIRTLRDKESLIPVILGENSSVYSSEKTVLVVICALFMFSYFVDFLYNAVVLKDFYKHKCFDWGKDEKGNKECDYSSYFLLTELYYIVDPLPIMVILVVHWQNFRLPSKLDQSSMNRTANITALDGMKGGHGNNGGLDQSMESHLMQSVAASALIFDDAFVQSQESFICKR